MSKKVIIIGLLAAAALSWASFNPKALSADNNFDNQKSLLVAAGVYAGDEAFYSNLSKTLNRGEFIHYVVRLLNLEYRSGGKSPFWDLGEDYIYYDSIITAADMGLIGGYEDGGIHVYDGITAEQALAVLLNAMGYKPYALLNGGYPMGYLAVNRQLGLAKGLELSKQLDYSAMTQLLFNAATAPMLEQTAFGEKSDYDNKSGETILSKYRSIYSVEGIVNADPVCALRGDDKAVPFTLDIGGRSIKTGSPDTRYIGYNVTCFYLDSGSEYEAVSVYKTGNTEVVIPSAEPVALGDNRLYYSDAKRSVTFDTDAVFLYNGMPIDYNSEYGGALFDIGEGEIICVDNDRDRKFDVIFVNAYYNAVVKAADADEKLIYGENDILIDLGDEKNNYALTDTNGETVDLRDLKVGDILTVMSSADGSYTRITASFDKLTAQAGELEKAERYDVISLLDGGYEIAPDCYSENDVNYYIGKTAVYYLNAFGRVAAIRSGVAEGEKFALLVNAEMETGLCKSGKIQILDNNSDGETAVLTLAEKVRIDGESREMAAVIAELRSNPKSEGRLIGQFIRYKTNEKGLVSMIDTPHLGDKEEKLSLTHVWGAADGELTYKGAGYFCLNYYKNDSSLFFGLPTDAAMAAGDYDCEYYSALVNDKKYTPDIYVMGGETVYIAGALVKKDSSLLSFEVEENSKMFVVDKISDAIDEKGGDCKVLKLVSGKADVSVRVYEKEYALIEGLERGDVIRYKLSLTGKLQAVHKIYDHTTGSGVAGNDAIYSSHNTVYVGTAYDTYEDYLKIALTDRSRIDDTIETLPKSAMITLKAQGYIAEIRGGGVVFTPVNAKTLKTYINSGNSAYTVIEVMRYKQHIDMLFIK